MLREGSRVAMATKSGVYRRQRRRIRPVGSGASAIWQRRRQRVIVVAVGFTIALAWGLPHMIPGWNALAERAALRLFYGPRDFERDAHMAGEKVGEQSPRLNKNKLELIFDKYVKGLKTEPPEKPLRTISHNSFLSGQSKQASKEKTKP